MGLHFDYLTKQFDIGLLSQLPEETVELLIDTPEPESNTHDLSKELTDGIGSIKKKVKTYGCSFKTIINELMIPGDGKNRLGNFHTTELIRCPRAAAYNKLAGEDESLQPVNNFTAHSRFIFAVGKVYHCLLQGMIKSLYPTAEIEKPVVCEGLHLHGSADAVIGNELIEIKTIKSAPAFPLEEHLYQVMLYSGVLHLPRWTIIYIDKSSTDLKVFPGEFSTKLWDEISQSLVVLNTVYKDKLPPPPPNISNYTCSTCPWRQLCRGS